MKVSHLVIGILPSAAAAYQFGSSTVSDALAAEARANFLSYNFDKWVQGDHDSSCKPSQLRVRKEWNTLSKSEKRHYIAANKCMLKLQNKNKNAPGARTRWDDFLVAHVDQVYNIHNTGQFLSWHRIYVLAWETTLRNECGYRGVQPYANWAKIALDPINAPVFDGSDVSLGGNGKYINQSSNLGYVPGGVIPLPTAQGGGCVEQGPFANTTINIGPADSKEYNPRCLSRDILQQISAPSLQDANITALVKSHDNVLDFQNAMQSVGNVNGPLNFATWGVHPGGHFVIAGTPAADFWLSPGDPWFWLHHGMIDRTWWTWQNLDPANRTLAIAGDRAAFGAPYNGTTQLGDHLVVNTFTFPDWTVGSALNTAARDLCYYYD